MNPKTRLQKLEAQAAPQGHCPRSHEVARFLKPDGSDSLETEFPKKCECGQEVQLTEIHLVPYRADDQSEETQ
jgi:hypothetical protein